MTSPSTAIRVEVQPLPHLPSTRLGESSSSAGQQVDIAHATESLLKHLLGSSSKSFGSNEAVYIAVKWPEERRIPGKGKKRSLVIQVKPPPDDLRHDATTRMLYIPLQLLPRYSEIPLLATVTVHRPIELSQVILQPITSTTEISEIEELDLGDFISSRVRAGGTVIGKPNGHMNGHAVQHDFQLRILREGHNVLIPSKKDRQTLPFRVIMLEPVAQGYLSAQTRVILSTIPYDPDSDIDGEDGEESIYDQSSHGKTHLSMADFDPDAFLSTSLALALHPSSDGDYVDEEREQSVSSTSGSITPRPPGTVVIPSSPPARPLQMDDLDELDGYGGGTKFGAVGAYGAVDGQHDVCWVSVGGLGRAGIFEGDWVLLRSATANGGSGRLTRVLAWERLDVDIDDLPPNPIIVPPDLFRSLFPLPDSQNEVVLQPTPFSARTPNIPSAHSVSISRLATTEGVDRRYEKSWLRGLKSFFTVKSSGTGGSPSETFSRLSRRGDIFAVPVWQDVPTSPDGEAEQSDDDEHDAHESEEDYIDDIEESTTEVPTGIVYFKVTAINYEPLVPMEEDFRSSISSKARAGELGCWIDVGPDGATQMVLEGVERERLADRRLEKTWCGAARCPRPFSRSTVARLQDLFKSSLPSGSGSRSLQMSILIKGARGAGKKSLIHAVADEVGFNVVLVDCYDIVGETMAVTEGSLQASLEKAKSAAPSILLLKHIEALAKRSESAATGKSPPIVKIIDDLLEDMKVSALEIGCPIILMGTTVDEDSVPGELLSCFKQDLSITAPNEEERFAIVQETFAHCNLAPDVNFRSIATQTAALQAGDIRSLALRAQDMSLRRAQSFSLPIGTILEAGLSVTSADISTALNDARSSYSDSIGAPKIPNVSWDDIGGLQHVKDDILDTIQLPLQHPELFAQGLKKRSGILLYGPPGTGKTLLAKAVATSCSLNFFSVKGPELLNMYIGESEANVRRVFQRARDASPCVVFMDELDSIAPKRGNQGDSGGVMDRIVSQLLAELDGMSSGGGNTQVYVLGATNRPDLLDPALLRPGRFDRMLYLSVATTDAEQFSILQALTRKFKLDPSLDLAEISRMCPFNYTGADFYALCSDAMLKAMTRAADKVDDIVQRLNRDPGDLHFPRPLTVQYYLASLATKEDIEVKVGKEDFLEALRKMKPSVSESEMKHYERVQQDFKGFAIGADK